MTYVLSNFTDHNKMVGQRPRQVYWQELQEAIVEIGNRTNSEQLSIVPYRSATDSIEEYPKGMTSFQVQEVESSGYPTVDGIVETIHIDKYRNIQHFFDFTADDKNGSIYYRQWKPELRGWTNWGAIITDRDLAKHADDQTKHITLTDRKRLDGYVHYEPSASDTWVINHDLNKYPNVQVVDSAGSVVVCDIEHVSKQKAILTFSNGFQGTAYLS